jgi:hypothetical protein
MKVKCVSIRNPVSYLICYGVCDVENRSWNTDYRGTLYIHSIGPFAYSGMPDFSEYPMPVVAEFDRFLDEIEKLEATGRFIGFSNHGVQVYLKNERAQTDAAVAEYNLLSDVYNFTFETPDKPFFLTNAIIGHVELIDVVENSRSVWAEKGAFHWVFRNPVLLHKPLIRIPGDSSIWDFEIS